MKAAWPRVSYTDLQRAPDDGRRYELYDGEALVVPAPRLRHQEAAWNISEILQQHARACAGRMLMAPIDIVLSEFDVVQPDVVFFSAARQHLVQLDEPVRVPPDIAVEVLSPATEDADRGRKMELMARYGLREYWLVDPVDRRIELYSLEGGSYHLVQIATQSDQVRSLVEPKLIFAATRVFAR